MEFLSKIAFWLAGPKPGAGKHSTTQAGADGANPPANPHLRHFIPTVGAAVPFAGTRGRLGAVSSTPGPQLSGGAQRLRSHPSSATPWAWGTFPNPLGAQLPALNTGMKRTRTSRLREGTWDTAPERDCTQQVLSERGAGMQ